MKQYVVDAFTDQVFAGNPAAVCVMDEWPTDEFMTKMAMENNLSETAFTVREGEKYHLRWFTPAGEVELCGHATLATSFVLFNYYEKDAVHIDYTTLSGILSVDRIGDRFELDFPAYELEKVEVTPEMAEAYGAEPVEAYMGADLLCVFGDEDVVRGMNPDQAKLSALPGLLQHAAAKGADFDYVIRSFAPKCSVAEDPVCGRGQCHAVPYFAAVSGKAELTAYQASRRSGTIYCRLVGNRAKLAGKAVLFSIDEVFARF